MRDIKTKITSKDIKALDKAADVSFRIKNAYIRNKEQAEQMQQPEHDGYIQYAEDKVNDSIEAIGGKVGHSMERQGKKQLAKTAQAASQAAKRTAQAAQSIQRTAQTAKTAARFTVRIIKLTVRPPLHW